MALYFKFISQIYALILASVMYVFHDLIFKDVGLIVEFSAFELMMFFGALYRMRLKKIREKMQMLVKLLEIPALYQRIGTMR